MAEDAVICVQCGYDTRSGRRLNDSAGPRFAIPWGTVGLIAVLAAAGLAAYLYLQGAAQPPPPSTAPAPVAQPQPPPEPAAAEAEPQALAQTQPEAAQPEPSPVAESAAEAAPPEAVEPPPQAELDEAVAEPPKPVIDRAALEAEQRALLTQQMDARFPMFYAGEEVALRLTNGIVKRGTFRNRADNHVVLAISTNELLKLPFTSLDRETRVRCEVEYRERFIEFRAKQRAEEMAKELEAASAAPAP